MSDFRNKTKTKYSLHSTLVTTYGVVNNAYAGELQAVRRVHPDLSESIVGSYIANARPMLGAKETFHNCVARVTLEYDSRVQRMPLQKQCTVFRGKTFIQTDEDRIQMAMTITGSAAQMILNLPEMNMKTQVAAVNGQIFLTIIQPFSETLYYEALLEELKEQGIPYTEYGTESNRTEDVLL